MKSTVEILKEALVGKIFAGREYDENEKTGGIIEDIEICINYSGENSMTCLSVRTEDGRLKEVEVYADERIYLK